MSKKVGSRQYEPSSGKGTICDPAEGKTRQDQADLCDINKIMARADQGIAPWVPQEVGAYGDFTQVGDLRESLERVRRADEAFMALPVKVRNAYDNDVTKFAADFQTEEGLGRLRELKVVAESEETLADKREAAAERRAIARAAARAEAERVEAARQSPVVPKP